MPAPAKGDRLRLWVSFGTKVSALKKVVDLGEFGGHYSSISGLGVYGV